MVFAKTFLSALPVAAFFLKVILETNMSKVVEYFENCADPTYSISDKHVPTARLNTVCKGP